MSALLREFRIWCYRLALTQIDPLHPDLGTVMFKLQALLDDCAAAQRAVRGALVFGLAAALLAALAPDYAHAEPQASGLSVVVHGLSTHGTTPDRYTFNERNLGLGLRQNITPALSLQAGAYYNSYRCAAVYAALNYMPLGSEALRAGAFVAVVTGYAKPLGAGLIASLKLSEALRLETTFVPKLSRDTTYAFAAQANVRF
jgi:hypothetical protein